MQTTTDLKQLVEAVGDAIVASDAGGAIVFPTMLDASPVLGAVFGVAVVCTATLGDLGESMVKRDIGIKDMSNLLPGHGGLMDRLDSILFAVPTAYLLFALIGANT